MTGRNEMICMWSALVFAAIALVGCYPFADFNPPPSPNLSAEEIVAIWQGNTLSMRFGILHIMIGGGL